MFDKKLKIISLGIVIFLLAVSLIFLFIFKNNKTADNINTENGIATTSTTVINKIIAENYGELKNAHPEFSAAQLEFYYNSAVKGDAIASCEGRDDANKCVSAIALLTESYFVCGDEILEEASDQIKCTDPVLSKIAAIEIAKCSAIDIIDFKIECLVNIFRVYAKPEDCSNFADDEVKKMCQSVVNYQMARSQNKREVLH